MFTIKFDMADNVEDAMLVASLTNGAETVLGSPTNDASLVVITHDDNFVFCNLKSELTQLFTSATGMQKYDIKVTDVNGINTVAYGNCNVVLSGS